jgi:lysophospholipase L1-like esterase
MMASLLVGVAIAILGTAPLRVLAEELPAANTPQKVLRFVPTDSVGATAPEAPSAIKKVSMPPNRIVVELNHSGTADGVLEVFSGQPLCLGEVSGCQSVISQASDNHWEVAITGRQAGVKQLVEIANRRTATDAVTPRLFDRRRHDHFMKRKSEEPVGLLFLGDSITDWWPKNGKDSWAEFAPYQPANFGIMAMRTEGLLWNITNGEIDGLTPKTTVILIGVNNVLQCPDEKPEWVAAGIGTIVATAREKMPDTKIVLMGILPARNPASHPARARIAAVNQHIAKLADGKHVRFLDIGTQFLDADGNVRRDLTGDSLHPNAKGYQVWKNALLPIVSSDAGK